MSRTKQCLSVQGMYDLGEPGRETVRRIVTLLLMHGDASENSSQATDFSRVWSR
jgi:hypothetical protein